MEESEPRGGGNVVVGWNWLERCVMGRLGGNVHTWDVWGAGGGGLEEGEAAGNRSEFFILGLEVLRNPAICS